MLQTFLSSIVLIGLGAIGGFGVFHFALQDRIQRTEESHNATLAIVQGKCVASEAERARCMDQDDGRLQEMSELRGRLDAQYKNWYELTAAQQSLTSSHQEITTEAQNLRERKEQDQAALEDLAARLGQKDRDLTAVREVLENRHRSLEEINAQLGQKDRDLIAIKEDLDTNHRTRIELESELTKMREQAEQKNYLENETRELKARIQQKDNELDGVKQNSEHLHNQKRDLEGEVAGMREKVGDMEWQIERKNEELAEQRIYLENETRELHSRIQQKDKELEGVKQNSESLHSQKRNLEEEVAGLREKVDEMEGQIEGMDKELSEYRTGEISLETKLLNLREGMVGLLKGKIDEIQDLENNIENLNKDKANLELKLDNWRDGMLILIKDKIEETNRLKAELAESQQNMQDTMNEIESARSQQDEVEEFVREKQGTLDKSDQEGDEQEITKLKEAIEQLNNDLRESRDWVAWATREIDAGRSKQAESEKLITDKSNEIEDLKLKIKQNQESTGEMISKLESDLETARKLVEEKTNQIERVNSELTELVTTFNNLKPSPAGASVTEATTSEILIDHIQQRDSVMCRQLFGKGSYYVKFVIRLPPNDASNAEENTAFFVVEIPSRKQLPHSTYTFLTLVESNIYNDGAAFLFAQDGGLQIRSSSHSDVPSLEQKLKPLGLPGRSSLGFVETSTSGKPLTCGENSFGFVHRGPGLNIFFWDKGNDGGDTIDCFAQVIRGHKQLRDIQHLLLERGEPLEIVSAEHLRVD
eukprot:CAMPEP_0168177134 /NCGR_PEP_ID=MMETSP0139_2-20121125/8259_1 /TAXON_ID=44445 /ORGANISM="Pseudo-nitzschia australis, Strain 10249 10 AB" /LENGTH=763 /DNA_ID=CAMNT_0008096099 /DNA_START=254 /DNA_END=2545 /DNA_ORIENTATION=+